MRGAAFALIAAVFAGCTPMQWVKPEGTPAQLEKDSAECRDAAWREASSYYYYGYGYAPWFPSYGYPAGYPAFGLRGPRPFGPAGYYHHTDRFYEEERLTQFCLRAKGYQLVPLEKSATE